MGASIQDTGAFDATALNYSRCPECNGTGELRIDSENINEHFEVEKQTVIGPSTRDCIPVSYVSCYGIRMAETITFRPDEDALRALALLTRDGTPVSTVVRGALIDAARHRAEQQIRKEAEALAADEVDRAEAAQVLRDMETLRAW